MCGVLQEEKYFFLWGKGYWGFCIVFWGFKGYIYN